MSRTARGAYKYPVPCDVLTDVLCRKCQVEDWKSGRHKIVCGKAIDMQTARIYSDTRPRESLQRDPEEPIPEREWKEVMRLYKMLEPTLDLD